MVLLLGLSFVGQYRDALGDATNLAPLYAFVAGVLAYHYGNRVADMRPAFAIALAALSVVTFCCCGMRNQSGIVLAVECAAAAGLVVLIVWQQLAIFKSLDFAVVRFYGRILCSLYLLHPDAEPESGQSGGGLGHHPITIEANGLKSTARHPRNSACLRVLVEEHSSGGIECVQTMHT